MASSSQKSAPFYLTPLDNIPGAPYIHKALFFPNHHSDVSSVVQNLTSALAQTFNAIPLLAGTVTHVSNTSQRGNLAVTAPWRTAQDAIMVNDLRKTGYPSYETLRSKHFPTVDINYSILMPTRKSMRIPKVEPPDMDERPVLLAQINLIKGGMILGFVVDHAFTDGAGSITVVRVWASYCRGEDGSQLVSHDFVDRTQLMEGDKSGKIEDFDEYIYHPEPKISAPAHGFLSRIFQNPQSWIVRSLRSLLDFGLSAMDRLRAVLPVGPARDTSRSEPDPLAGEIFFFSRAKLKELKQMASKLETDETSWISTNDALASLIWCCVTTAYKTDIHNDSESTKDRNGSVKRQINEKSSVLVFVINARQYLRPALPARFIGNVLIWGGIMEPFSTVVPTPEGVTKCAHSLRRKMKQYDDAYLPRLIGALKSISDVSRVRLAGIEHYGLTCVVNSWAMQEWYDLDWGKLMGGRCERLRIHKTKFENFCLVLPELKGCEGSHDAAGLEVIISIKKDQMKTLRENELWNRFAEWRCS